MDKTFHRRATDMIDTSKLTDAQLLLVLQSRVLGIETKLSKHHEILMEGNGVLPLVEKVRNLENFASNIRFWLRTVAVAIVLQTVTFAVAAVVYFVRLYPILENLAKQP